jgi:hypothetical protein
MTFSWFPLRCGMIWPRGSGVWGNGWTQSAESPFSAILRAFWNQRGGRGDATAKRKGKRRPDRDRNGARHRNPGAGPGNPISQSNDLTFSATASAVMPKWR